LRLYWDAVRHEGAEGEREAQERFLLASLVPRVRVEGSRTIFADAFLRAPMRSDQSVLVRDLDSLLARCRTDAMTREEFHALAWNVLGRRKFPDGLRGVYDSLVAEAFGESCRLLSRGNVDQSIEMTSVKWQSLMRKVGRRGGHVVEKVALDVLSYESRAAFHDCYSVAWCALIPLLAAQESFGRPTTIFHRFWHTDWKDSQTGTSLFHGHVFGLHPAMGPFIRTPTGRELLGGWLADPTSAERLGNLLMACHGALYDYSDRRDLAAADRRNRRHEVAMAPEAAEEVKTERRQGRRRRGS